MEKRAVLVDVDDTLNRLQVGLLQYTNQKSRSVYRYFDLSVNERESRDQKLDVLVQEYLNRPDLVIKTKPFNQALEGVKLLYMNSYQIHIASSRKEPLHQATEDWLKIHGFLPFITDIHPRYSSISGREFKIQTARKIGAVAAFDDTQSVAEILSQANIPVYLIRRPWNKHLKPGEFIKPHPSFYKAVVSFINSQNQ